MSDLNEMMCEWRIRIGAEAWLSPQELDELEDHIREAFESLSGVGLSAEEAFLIAPYRVGFVDELGKVFWKVGGIWRLRHRLQHMITVVLVLPVLGISALMAYESPNALNPWQEPVFWEPSWVVVLLPLAASLAIILNGLVGALSDYQQST